ncbi:MAG: asparagine synthase (glutamine-hydrolyzing) [Pseudomonadota bacterium]|nr:asparagine synthase (glutamine-hydrolyzing) [Pseudomonadota bacterium]MDE3038861.1 asparagine synthase (glutamine-hydrolyzing) [Pseudomonadota bacterium]
MCGIGGLLDLRRRPLEHLPQKQRALIHLLKHRGPDGEGAWATEDRHLGLIHTRLSIIDLSDKAAQPMHAQNGAVITYNGEIYNYRELREELRGDWNFRSNGDTEVILAGYAKWGAEVIHKLRGMFSFALWDPAKNLLWCARDRFGIKPFYYTVQDGVFYFASEAKALLPFLPEIDTDHDSLNEYFALQNALGEHTLFKGVKRLQPAHDLAIRAGQIKPRRYWDVTYGVDEEHSGHYFHEELKRHLDDSVKLHLRSDVPVGSYLSGGIDSSLLAILASRHDQRNNQAFHGRFSSEGCDESAYAEVAAQAAGKELHRLSISEQDFPAHIERVIYHLDYPTAGPGAFPQYLVSRMAAKQVKVIIGGQGGDEIFGGYARYLIAYFEQCIKAAIEGTYKDGHFVVTAESIIPNLVALKEYKPLIKMFWADGVFDSLDLRYFRLIDRFSDLSGEIKTELFDRRKMMEDFLTVFNSVRRVRHESYFDSMTHYDFKTLLPALLHVEDRMSMAHGLESRVPFLDHPLVEFTAKIPADVKFKDGNLKLMLKKAYADVLPQKIINRQDKMGFTVPLVEWFNGPLKPYLMDTFSSRRAKERYYLNADRLLANLDTPGKFSRKLWGFLSLELWQQQFHDRAGYYKNLANFSAKHDARPDTLLLAASS